MKIYIKLNNLVLLIKKIKYQNKVLTLKQSQIDKKRRKLNILNPKYFCCTLFLTIKLANIFVFMIFDFV